MEGHKNKVLSSTNTVLKLVSIATKYRKVIIHCVLVATMTVIVVAFLMPNRYQSTASVFPIEQSKLTAALGSVSSPLNTFSRFRRSFYGKYLSKSIGSIETDRCLAILKSKTVLRAVIQKFNLVHVYNIKTYPIENTIKELLDNIEFKVVLEGNIYITVYDEDPNRAADMANYFVDLLNTTNSEIMSTSVQLNQQLVNEYYRSAQKNLSAARDSLKYLQERSAIIALSNQTKAYINTTANLTGQLMAKQVYADVLRKTLAFDHPSVRAVELEIEELQKEITNVNNGRQMPSSGIDIFTPFSKLFDFKSDYEQKYFDVEYQYNYFQYMTWLNEQAKVEVQRNTPAVVILESAFPAERKSKPYRFLIILGGIFIGGVSAFSLSMIYDNWIRRKKENPAFYESLIGMRNKINDDFMPLRQFINRLKGA